MKCFGSEMEEWTNFDNVVYIVARGRGIGGRQRVMLPPPPTFFKSEKVPHLRNAKAFLE